MVRFDERLGRPALRLLEPMLQGADGLLDERVYGATWKDADKPDFVAVLVHAGAGFVVINAGDPENVRWLSERFMASVPEDGTDADFERFLVMVLDRGWMLATIPVWAQIVHEATRGEKSILATRDVDKANEILREALAESRKRHAETHPTEIVDRVVGGRLARINMDDLINHPERIAALIQQATGEMDREHESGLHSKLEEQMMQRLCPGGLASERFADADLSDENPAFARADEIQEAVETALAPHLSLEDGYYGAVPTDPLEVALLAPQRAHLHAEITLENGLVYLHPTAAEEAKGICFITQVLCMSLNDNPPLAHPVGIVSGPGLADLSGIVGASISVWPLVVEIARECGIVIYQGECPDDDHNEDPYEAPTPDPVRPTLVPTPV